MIVNFTSEKITDHLYRIRGVGDACMYFIRGTERGLLVDTAYGVGDLRDYIENTFKIPYDVVVTHGHADHANGIAQWDRVYMNHADIDLYWAKTDVAFRKSMLKRTVPDIEEYPDGLFQGVFRGEFLDLQEGMKFDLGGVTVEPYHAPGHTQGIMVLLIVEDRICLFGDACGVFTFLFKPESSTVDVYRRTLSKLLAMKDKYDRILRQHGTCESPLSLVEENLEVAEEILKGTDDHIPWQYQGQNVWIAKKSDMRTGLRADGKSGNIVYDEHKIKEEVHKMRKIVLFCAAGMSTSLLVSKMKKAAQEAGLDYQIDAHPLSETANYGPDADMILLGPQVMYKLKDTQKQFPDKPVEAIKMQDYGMMRGDNVIKRVREVLGD